MVFGAMKEAFYSKVNLEGNTDADYTHVNKVCRVFERKTWG